MPKLDVKGWRGAQNTQTYESLNILARALESDLGKPSESRASMIGSSPAVAR
ncbi:hypothetical protein X751_29525 [Mesorhizobium sp. LNJC395A00]|nr:hypothetical protein X751_29525 [Mesorhizobium sp. LNJC395A00]